MFGVRRWWTYGIPPLSLFPDNLGLGCGVCAVWVRASLLYGRGGNVADIIDEEIGKEEEDRTAADDEGQKTVPF